MVNHRFLVTPELIEKNTLIIVLVTINMALKTSPVTSDFSGQVAE